MPLTSEQAALCYYVERVRADGRADPRPLSPSGRGIAAATGLTDPGDLAVVEDMMRADRTSLDDLTPRAFAALARESHAACRLAAGRTAAPPDPACDTREGDG